MSELNRQARVALEIVARHLSATWNPLESPGAVGGQRAAVQLASLKRLSSGTGKAAKIRLRFDKVAIRVITRLQAAAAEHVPDGTMAVVTITAPIRLASKTTASTEDMIRILVARKRLRQDAKATIHGNRIRVRILENKSERAPKLIGFVHNSDSNPALLLDMTQQMLELFVSTQHHHHEGGR